MVNFKAAAHQGEHKRALALQDSSEARTVSKLEKLSIGVEETRQPVNAEGIVLKVVAREKLLGETNALLKTALVSADTYDRLAQHSGFIRRPGGDHVLSIRSHDTPMPGTILLNEAQRLSLHVCEDDAYEWIPFPSDYATPVLADLTLECQLLQPRDVSSPLEVDAAKVASAVGKAFFAQLVSTNELFIIDHHDEKLVLRVTELNLVHDDDEYSSSGLVPYSFRGLVQPCTRIYVTLSTSFYAHRGVIDGLRLLNTSTRPAQPPRNCIRVLTSDGEEFPVARQLLRCCISLTKAVRDLQAEEPSVSVNVDCCTFDRVLLFLEVCCPLWRGQEHSPPAPPTRFG